MKGINRSPRHSMQSQGNANHFVSIGINFGILLLSIYPTWLVLRDLRNASPEGKSADADEKASATQDHASL